MSDALVKSWSPSRYEKYKRCPLLFKLEYIEHLCPLCFKGKLTGYENPTCDTCGGHPGMPTAITRGTHLHKALEEFVKGLDKKWTMADAVILKNVLPMAKALRERFKKGLARAEAALTFARGWTPTRQFSSDVWLRTKADVLDVQDATVEITDWKAGGIDKRTGRIRKNNSNDDAMEIYGIAALSAMPSITEAKPRLVYIDGPPKEMIIERAPVKRKDLVKLQRKWDGKVMPIFKDRTFAPLANELCKYCDFRRDNGGPCPY